MGKIILSCTTTNERLNLLFYMVESLKKQTLKPDLFFVNISSEPYLFDEGITNIPFWLNNDFVKINWVKNTGPYRKLLPVIEKVDSGDILITADDDVLYNPLWLKDLVQLAEKHPQHIICTRARVMKKNVFGCWQNYINWEPIEGIKEGMLLLPIGCGGIVFRKNLVDMDFLLNPISQKISPTTDDLWFRMASLIKETPVYVCQEIDRENIHLEHKKGLMKRNVKQREEIYINRVIESTFGKIRNWIGRNNSENDRAWLRIIEYSNVRL